MVLTLVNGLIGAVAYLAVIRPAAKRDGWTFLELLGVCAAAGFSLGILLGFAEWVAVESA